MLLTSCGMFRPMYIERTDTVWRERKDTITKTITKTVNDTTKEVHNYYYTINNAGDTMLTNQNHFHYHSNETNDSSDYYRNLWMMEKEKGETRPLPPPSTEGRSWADKLFEAGGWIVAGIMVGMLLLYVIRKKLSPKK